MTTENPATRAQDAPGARENPAVVSFTDRDGITYHAWRRDGIRPVFDRDAARNNSNMALDGAPGADFVSRFPPEAALSTPVDTTTERQAR